MTIGLLRVLLEPEASADGQKFQAWRLTAFRDIPGIYQVEILTAKDEIKVGNTYRYENAYHIENVEAINESLVKSLLLNAGFPLARCDWHLYERIAFNERTDVGPRQRGTVFVTVGMSPIETKEIMQDFYNWYQQEHMPILRDVPGWRTGSRYKRVTTIGDNAEFAAPYVAIHQYNPENGLGGEQWSKSMKSPWTKRVMSNLAAPNHRRVYETETQ
jgi:hypothetical protein